MAFTGGGTGGHIYPGLAVSDSFRRLCEDNGVDARIVWLGSRGKMDKKIVGEADIDKFYAVPSGKLRRYFSLYNLVDAFKIFFGLVYSLCVLIAERPRVLFSKGGFVSVPPCVAARILGIRVFTHECDFTPGLATRINARFAEKILLTYEETRACFKGLDESRLVVTGNPVRPIFYGADKAKGLEFLGIGGAGASAAAAGSENSAKTQKPILFVTGGSLGASQINALVFENLEWLCERFIVVHQTGKNCIAPDGIKDKDTVAKNYRPFEFIYSEMPNVLAAADVIMCRAGANSIWEGASLSKPMLLLPLEGSGTRGDQVENAGFFQKAGAALVLRKSDATGENLKSLLETLLDEGTRSRLSEACRRLCGAERPAEKIAGLLFDTVDKENE